MCFMSVTGKFVDFFFIFKERYLYSWKVKHKKQPLDWYLLKLPGESNNEEYFTSWEHKWETLALPEVSVMILQSRHLFPHIHFVSVGMNVQPRSDYVKPYSAECWENNVLCWQIKGKRKQLPFFHCLFSARHGASHCLCSHI